jgi:hypothetical protein
MHGIDRLGLDLGIEKGHFHITNDALGHIFRNCRGLGPMNSLLDLFWAFVALVSGGRGLACRGGAES